MLRNRKELDETKLKGVILSADPAKLQVGRFTSLQNIVPKGLAHLRKKRGVELLRSSSVTPTIPTECAGDGAPGSPGGGGTVLVEDYPPTVTPGSNPSCPTCESFVYSVPDQEKIEQCYIDSGCTDETCRAYCERLWGSFIFGMNAKREDSFTPVSYWRTTYLWIPPGGYIVCNSSCAGRIMRIFRFDTRYGEILEPPTGEIYTQTNLTIDQVLPRAASLIAGGAILENFDCAPPGPSTARRHLAINGYGSYLAEENQGIAGIAWLTNDGSTSTITGYGLLIDRVTSTIRLVKWSGTVPETYTLLTSASYTPMPDDELTLAPRLMCTCPEEVNKLPEGPGWIEASIFRPSTGTIWSFATAEGSMVRSEFETLKYFGIVVLQVDNGLCNNTITFKTLTMNLGTGSTGLSC